MAGSRADAPEESEGYGDHECAGAGDHEEHQSAMDPFGEGGAGEEQGREDRQGESGEDDDRGVEAGKSRDETLGRSLVRAGVLDEVEDARHRGGLELLRHFDVEQSAAVDRPGEDPVSDGHVPRHGLAGDG